MQRFSSTTAPQVILLLFLGSYVCARQLSDNYDMMRLLYSSPGYYKRLPSYDFGLGKRSFEDSSNEEGSPLEPSSLLDKDSTGMYPFGPSKRNRAYGFGLGKRLMENDWKAASLTPTFRQERRSKIYSFGLGKRSHFMNEDYDVSPPSVERRASQRQFAFGLGKRDLKLNGSPGSE